jgi:antitoxin MazE
LSLKLRRKISESGRTLALRIPKDIERSLKLKAGDEIDIWVENGKIIMQPLKSDV